MIEVTLEYLQGIITHQSGKIMQLENMVVVLQDENNKLKEPPESEPKALAAVVDSGKSK